MKGNDESMTGLGSGVAEALEKLKEVREEAAKQAAKDAEPRERVMKRENEGSR